MPLQIGGPRQMSILPMGLDGSESVPKILKQETFKNITPSVKGCINKDLTSKTVLLPFKFWAEKSEKYGSFSTTMLQPVSVELPDCILMNEKCWGAQQWPNILKVFINWVCQWLWFMLPPKLWPRFFAIIDYLIL